MAVATAAKVEPVARPAIGTPPQVVGSGRAASVRERVALALEAVPLTALPLLLGPLPPTADAALAVLGTAALLFLLDLAEASRDGASKPLPFLLALAAAGLAAWLGDGLPLLALLFLPLRLCARRWQGRSLGLAAALGAAVAACRVEAGVIAAGHAGAPWLLLAAASLGAFAALARDGSASQAPGAEARAPTRATQLRELLLVASLAGCAAANLAFLGADARLQAVGVAVALLPAPFLVLGLFRCARLALAAGGPSPRSPSLRDPLTAAAALGWAAALAAAPWLPALP